MNEIRAILSDMADDLDGEVFLLMCSNSSCDGSVELVSNATVRQLEAFIVAAEGVSERERKCPADLRN
jgi:hypothetical protein